MRRLSIAWIPARALVLVGGLALGVGCGADESGKAGGHAAATSDTGGNDAVPPWAKVSRAQVEAAQTEGVPVAFENDIGMRFVFIPAGTFLMGSPTSEEGRQQDEAQHEVRLTKSFYLSIYETRCRDYGRYEPSHENGTKGKILLEAPEFPVVRVSHDDALKFTEWLSGRDRKYAYSLPTEAQWECACRAGSKANRYWGEDLDVAVRWANVLDSVTKTAEDVFGAAFPGDDGHRGPAPSGAFLPNAWGLYDMLGNVQEWCMDWYGPYPGGSSSDPQGPTTGDTRVTRGGNWLTEVGSVRNARRAHLRPTEAEAWDLGFRVTASRR